MTERTGNIGMRYVQSIVSNDISNGKCAADTNPNAWFPAMPDNRPSKKALASIVKETKRAIEVCNSCPAKQKCLEVGMQDVNIAYGIWGGLLPDERVQLAGKTFGRWSDEGRALFTINGLRRYMEEA